MSTGHAWSQNRPALATGLDDNSGVFLPANRVDSRGIQRAKESIAAGEFTQAIRYLDEVLARPEDSFFPGSDQEYSGLKETARQILRSLPPEGQQVYQSMFSPVSRRLLQQSVERGNFALLREITQRYFYTPAGHEAALLFAQNESDQGRHLTAALTYQQLLESKEASRFEPQLSLMAAMSWLAVEETDRADEIMQRIKRSNHREIQVAGEGVAVRTLNNEPIDWLLRSVGKPQGPMNSVEQQWLTARGNAARNGQAKGGLPHLRVRWQVRMLEHHALEEVHNEISASRARLKDSMLPAASPLAVGDYVVTRSAHGLVAIDFKSGKRIWRSQPQRENLLQKLMESTQQQNQNGNNLESAQQFTRMVWEDYLYNTSSSDGQRVYVIRDLTSPVVSRAYSAPFMPMRNQENEDESTNRLCAYDLPTQGKLIWEIDGAARQDELKGAFFLGAPVTVGQALYCLVEIKSETAIYLAALNRQSGKLLWRQQLADLEDGITRDTRRRLQSSSPSYDGGILVCPTGAGVVVGVDLAKRALAWAYRYETEPRFNFSRHNRNLQLRMLGAKVDSHWVHSAPVIAKGRVLLTPPESEKLHCVDLQTGKLHWQKDRGEFLFLAGVEDDSLLLVGNQSLSALKLDDGKPAWKQQKMKLPTDGAPSGSGFFSKGQYFLPLSNADVIAVDVAKGVVASKTSSREGQQLGNLISYRGAVISQTGNYLDCFEQIDVLRAESERRLEVDSEDFEALRTLGEIAYNDGKLAEAIRLLSRAYDSKPQDLRTREVLSEALVAALDENFADHQNWLPLLQKTQPDTAEAQLTLFRLKSKGLLEIGQVIEAFDVCLEAFANVTLLEAELEIGRDHRVSAPRWLAAQVAEVWRVASLDQRQQMQQQLAPLIEGAMAEIGTSQRQLVFQCFGTLEDVEALALEVAQDYAEQGELLAAQLMLLELLNTENELIRNAAIAHSSRILHQADRGRWAASFDTVLQGKLADRQCLDGLTGRECLEQWAGAGQAAKEPVNPDWPYGKVEASHENISGSSRVRSSRSPQTGIHIERGDEILGFSQVSLLGVISGQNREIMIQDSLGREFFRAKLDHGAPASINVQGGVYGVTRGNLLVLSLGRQIMAFDTLSESSSPLWWKNTTSNLQYNNQANAALRKTRAWQVARGVRSNINWIGIIGPVSNASCIFQMDQHLVCVDSLSGEIKWQRDDLPLGADLFGDEQSVYVVPKDAEQTLVFSAVDGRSLGTVANELPPWQQRLASLGKHVICWRQQPNRNWLLYSLDLSRGEVQWKYEFDKNAKVDISQNRFASVADSSGRCKVIDVREGSLIVDQPVNLNFAISEVHLLAGSEIFVISIQQSPDVAANRQFKGFNQFDFSSAFAGQLYAFDRQTGMKLWQHAAHVQGLPLMLAQPVDLPVIAFAGNIRRSDPHRTKPIMGLKLLEKSTGRLLYHDETLPQSPHRCRLRASQVEPNEIVVEMTTRKIKLKFTDQPRSPEPPANFEVQRRPGAGTKGLQKIGEKIFGGS